MLKKIFKITAIILGVIILIVVAFYTHVHFSIQGRLDQVYNVEPQRISVHNDSATLALGGRLVKTKGCTECHGNDLSGKIFVDDSALGLLIARNLTKGKGGLSLDHNEEDWVLALKHGLHRDRTPLLIMPAHEYTHLSEADMGAIISYCTQLEPIDREFPQSSIGPLAKVLTYFDKLPLIPAEKIDHQAVLVKEVKYEVSAEYGQYLSKGCEGCHRLNMKGGDPIAPGFPQVADISSTGHPGKWTDEQFINTLRTGLTPEGKKLNPADMPWTMTKEYTDVELKALHVYLKSI